MLRGHHPGEYTVFNQTCGSLAQSEIQVQEALQLSINTGFYMYAIGDPALICSE